MKLPRPAVRIDHAELQAVLEYRVVPDTFYWRHRPRSHMGLEKQASRRFRGERVIKVRGHDYPHEALAYFYLNGKWEDLIPPEFARVVQNPIDGLWDARIKVVNKVHSLGRFVEQADANAEVSYWLQNMDKLS